LPVIRSHAGSWAIHTTAGTAAITVSSSTARSRSRSKLRCNSSSARLRSVMSRKTSTHPTTSPPWWRMGAALSSMGRSVPSLAIRIVWFANPTTTPSRNALAAGFSTGRRVDSLTMRNTASSGWPAASAVAHPVSVSATGFRVVTRPAVSVVMTASPMLASVVRRRSVWSASRRRATSVASPNPAKVRHTTKYIANPIRCGPDVPRTDRRGGTKKNTASTNPSPVASRPARSPPAHDATATAAKKVANGRWSPRSGSSSHRASIATTTATTVTP
jgi:hypothetical protein